MRNDNKVDHLLEEYNRGHITSNEGIVRLFAILVQTGKINSLPKAYKRIVDELIYDGYISETGRVL
jgi:hypothetical protein